MKKLFLFIVLSITVPLLATITDEQYDQEVQKLGNKKGLVLSNLQKKDQTALRIFIVEGNLPAVQYLIEEQGLEPNKAIAGSSPLSLALQKGHTEIARYLANAITKSKHKL